MCSDMVAQRFCELATEEQDGSNLTPILAFYLALSGILPGIKSCMCFDILSDTLPGMYPDIHSDFLSGILSGMYADIFLASFQ